MEEHHKNLKQSGERAIKNLGAEWWRNLDKDNSEFINGLLNRVATIIANITPNEGGNSTYANSKKLPVEILDKLEEWIEKEVPKDLDERTKQIKSKVIQLKEFKKAENDEQQLNKDKPARKSETKKISSENGQNKNNLQVDKLEEKIDKSYSAINSIFEEFIKNNENEKRIIKKFNEDKILNFKEKIGEVKLLISECKKQNIENGMEILKYNKIISEGFLSIKEQLNQKIDIKESLQILDIKTEIERYTNSEFILKISKAIMPIIASIKTQDGMQNHEGIKLLEDKCLSSGLLSVERIYG